MSNSEKNKLEQRGWVDNEEDRYNNIPDKCPKCNSNLWVVNAANTCGIYLVMCRNSKCRWCKEYEV